MRLNMLLIIQQTCSWWLPEEGFLHCQLETIQTIYVKFWYGQKAVFQNQKSVFQNNARKLSNCRANRPFMHLKSSLRFKVKEVTTTWNLAVSNIFEEIPTQDNPMWEKHSEDNCVRILLVLRLWRTLKYSNKRRSPPPKKIIKNIFSMSFGDWNGTRSGHRLRLGIIIFGSSKVVSKHTPK